MVVSTLRRKTAVRDAEECRGPAVHRQEHHGLTFPAQLLRPAGERAQGNLPFLEEAPVVETGHRVVDHPVARLLVLLSVSEQLEHVGDIALGGGRIVRIDETQVPPEGRRI